MLAHSQEAYMLRPMYVLLALLLSPLPLQQPAAPASMPADAKTLVNPVKATADSQAKAKKMYGYDCTICHGENGDGKGEIAAEQKPPLKDWTDATALKDITDGEIFYIIKNGKGNMTGEGDRLKPDDLWNMVILVRSFAKKT
jgi:mono/diheme cytochrome c family protein